MQIRLNVSLFKHPRLSMLAPLDLLSSPQPKKKGRCGACRGHRPEMKAEIHVPVGEKKVRVWEEESMARFAVIQITKKIPSYKYCRHK